MSIVRVSRSTALTVPERASWRCLCPPGAPFITADEGWRSVRKLPSGSDVVLIDERIGSRGRLRRLAADADVEILRELIVLPNITAPIVVIDDSAEAVSHFWNNVATVPPGVTWAALPARLAVQMATKAPWSWTGLAPGRVMVGRRA